MPNLDSFARIPTGPRSRPQDTVRNLSAKGLDASAVGSLLRLSMGGEPIGYDDLFVDRLHVGSRGVYLLTRDVDSPHEASLSFVPHEDVLAGLPGFDKTWPSARSESVGSYECEDFLEPGDSVLLRDVGGHAAAGAPHPRAAEVAAAFAHLLTNIQTVRGMRAMTEAGRTALAAVDAHRSIRVAGCAECPAHHDEAGNGEWCGADNSRSYSHAVRNSANPDAPSHPEWCPLAGGPVLLCLS